MIVFIALKMCVTVFIFSEFNRRFIVRGTNELLLFLILLTIILLHNKIDILFINHIIAMTMGR